MPIWLTMHFLWKLCLHLKTTKVFRREFYWCSAATTCRFWLGITSYDTPVISETFVKTYEKKESC